MARSRPSVAALLLGAAALLAACDGGHDHDHGPGEEAGKAHEHEAPHGGTLVVLGEEFAHVEIAVDRATGAVTAWILDGEAEKAVRVAQPSLSLVATVGGKAVTVDLAAVANPLTGETAGDSSEFRGSSEALKGADRFEASLGPLSVKGTAFAKTPFRFPEGNEEPGGHDGAKKE
jgi:hypothetical protein